MKELIFVIPLQLISLNEYIQAERTTLYRSASIKKKQQEAIMLAILEQAPKWHTDLPVWVDFVWFVPNKRKDKDNIAWAKKFIFDAMVNVGIINNDNWNCVVGFSDSFAINKLPGVLVKIREIAKDTTQNEQTEDISLYMKRRLLYSQ